MKSSLLALLLVFGAITTAPSGAAAATQNLTQAAADPRLQAGLVSLYDLDYAATREQANYFLAANPTNPIGYLYLAGAVWWEVAGEAWARPGAQSDLLWKRFNASVKSTLKASRRQIKTKDKALRADGFFASGMALGLRGQMKLTQGKWLGAYRDGRKAMKYLRKCLKIDPNYYDAYLGLGIFDYQVAVLPGVLKFGAKLLFRGTGKKDRGLARIRLAMTKGRFANTQAASFLLTLVVLHEDDWGTALTITRDLLKDFPDSSYYRFVEVITLHRTGQFESSYSAARGLFDLNDNEELFLRKQVGAVCGLYGDKCLSPTNLDDALVWLTKAIAAAPDDAPDGFQSLLRLYRGMARDILGHRKGARIDYGKVIDAPEFAHMRKWAILCYNVPCRRKQTVRMLAGERPGPGGTSNQLIKE